MKHALKTVVFGLLVLLGPPAYAQQPVSEIAFDSVANLLKLPPDMNLGEVAGVAVNSKGHIFVYSRGGSSSGPAFGNTASQILEFAPDGKYVREIGKNLYAWAFAHTVRIDKDDNIWATDKGSDMVIKFNKEGRVVMVFGRKSEACQAARAQRNAAATCRRPFPPADRRNLGSRR
jgi:streptogramin lyase